MGDRAPGGRRTVSEVPEIGHDVPQGLAAGEGEGVLDGDGKLILDGLPEDGDRGFGEGQITCLPGIGFQAHHEVASPVFPEFRGPDDDSERVILSRGEFQNVLTHAPLPSGIGKIV